MGTIPGGGGSSSGRVDQSLLSCWIDEELGSAARVGELPDLLLFELQCDPHAFIATCLCKVLGTNEPTRSRECPEGYLRELLEFADLPLEAPGHTTLR